MISRRSAGDVVGELFSLELEFADPGLDHVADADQAGKLAVDNDRDVPDPAVGHQPHQVVDVLVRTAGGDLRRHDRADPDLARVRRTVPEPHDVALGDDAVHRHSVRADHDRTDVAFGQQREKFGDSGFWGDGDDLVALTAQYVIDLHGASCK